MKSGIAAFLAGFLLCSSVGTGAAAQDDVFLLRIRVLARDPDARQPKYECPAEQICLRYPGSYTADVRDVFSGDRVPRRVHVIIWAHTAVPQNQDLFVASTRQETGAFEALDWTVFDYAGCAPNEREPHDAVREKIGALRTAGRLPCKDGP